MRTLLALTVTLTLAAPAWAEPLSAEQARALVASAGRTEKDRERDARRHPAELLVFAKVGPGMQVADIGAGEGYTTELLARAVGPEGRVFAHNVPFVIENYVKTSWPERLKRPVNRNVSRVDAGLEAPLPPEAKGLDVITMIYFYHDALYQPVDRAVMNGNLLAALKPGGRLIIVDHHAKPGAGEEVGDTLHRIDEAMLRKELEAAGFRFDGSADFLRNPDDPREKAFFEMEGPTDAFVHRYVKPEQP